MIEVLYKRLPADMLEHDLTPEEVSYFEKERRGYLMYMTTELQKNGAMYYPVSVAYIADPDDGIISRRMINDLRVIGELN